MYIFDLDGTLIDSRRDIAIACNHALVKVGKRPLDEDLVGTFVGDGARMLIRRALGDDALVDRALEVFIEYYLAHPVVHTKLMPDAEDMLDALAGSPLAVATNKRRAVALAVLDALDIRTRFAHVWGGGDGKPKPDPACIMTILAEAEETTRDAWMIGDGSQDIGAGKAAGVRTIAVLGGFHDESSLRAHAPDFLIASLAEVPAIVTGEAVGLRSP